MENKSEQKEYTIGVDLGGTNIRVALIDEEGSIAKKLQRKTEPARGSDYTIAWMIDMIGQIQGQEHITGIGIGSPGPLDPKRGIILDPPNLPGWNGVPITSILEKACHLPVVLDNDANAAALAESVAGAGKGHESVVYVTISTGIGAGIVVDGKLWAGAQGNAGEVGNMIILPNGPAFPGLNAGALEALSSGTAIGQRGKNELNVENGSESVFELFKQGDEKALSIIDEAMNYLAIGLANIAHLLNPSLFVLGGGVMQQKEVILPILREKTASYLYESMKPHLKIEAAQLGTKAGVIGAGLLPRR
jgi:glucokinase